MSWEQFEATLQRSEEFQTFVADFREIIGDILARDPDSAIDEHIIASRSNLIDENSALDLLVMLEREHLLKTLLFWPCANGYGTSREASKAKDFPTFIECDRCGETHEFDQDCIEVRFVASDELVNSLRR